jgi:hypothetical protein
MGHCRKPLAPSAACQPFIRPVLNNATVSPADRLAIVCLASLAPRGRYSSKLRDPANRLPRACAACAAALRRVRSSSCCIAQAHWLLLHTTGAAANAHCQAMVDAACTATARCSRGAECSSTTQAACITACSSCWLIPNQSTLFRCCCCCPWCWRPASAARCPVARGAAAGRCVARRRSRRRQRLKLRHVRQQLLNAAALQWGCSCCG